MDDLTPLLELFNPLVFMDENSLLNKANELQIETTSLVGNFVLTAGKMCRLSNNRLFYLRCQKSDRVIDDAANYCFKKSSIKDNVFIASNDYHGSLLIIEFINNPIQGVVNE